MTMCLVGAVQGITGNEQNFGEVIVTAKEDKAFLNDDKEDKLNLVTLVEVLEEELTEEEKEVMLAMSGRTKNISMDKGSRSRTSGGEVKPTVGSRPGQIGKPQLEELVKPEEEVDPDIEEEDVVPEVEEDTVPEGGTVPQLDENGEFQLDLEFTMNPELESAETGTMEPEAEEPEVVEPEVEEPEVVEPEVVEPEVVEPEVVEPEVVEPEIVVEDIEM